MLERLGGQGLAKNRLLLQQAVLSHARVALSSGALAMLADGASACLSHPTRPTALNNGWWQSHTQGLAE